MAGISLAPDDRSGTTRPPPGTGSTTPTTSRPGASTVAAKTKCRRTDTGTGHRRARRPHRRLRPDQRHRRFYGRLTTGSRGPLMQAKIELQNQDTDAWSTLFRGFVACDPVDALPEPRSTPTSPSSWSTGSRSWPPAKWCPTAASATASRTATSSSTKTSTSTRSAATRRPRHRPDGSTGCSTRPAGRPRSGRSSPATSACGGHRRTRPAQPSCR